MLLIYFNKINYIHSFANSPLVILNFSLVICTTRYKKSNMTSDNSLKIIMIISFLDKKYQQPKKNNNFMTNFLI